jgi:hypothetical protein
MHVQDIPGSQRRQPLSQDHHKKYIQGIDKMCKFYLIPDETKEKLNKILATCVAPEDELPACAWTEEELDELFLQEDKLVPMRSTYLTRHDPGEEDPVPPKITPCVGKFYLVRPQGGRAGRSKKGQQFFDIVEILGLRQTDTGLPGCVCLYWVLPQSKNVITLADQVCADYIPYTAPKDRKHCDLCEYGCLEEELRLLIKGTRTGTKRLANRDRDLVLDWVERWEDKHGTFEHWPSDEEDEDSVVAVHKAVEVQAAVAVQSAEVSSGFRNSNSSSSSSSSSRGTQKAAAAAAVAAAAAAVANMVPAVVAAPAAVVAPQVLAAPAVVVAPAAERVVAAPAVVVAPASAASVASASSAAPASASSAAPASVAAPAVVVAPASAASDDSVHPKRVTKRQAQQVQAQPKKVAKHKKATTAPAPAVVPPTPAVAQPKKVAAPAVAPPTPAAAAQRAVALPQLGTRRSQKLLATAERERQREQT